MVRLQRQYNQYLVSKDKAIVDEVEREVEFTLPLLKTAVDRSDTQLKRTDLDHIETYLFQKISDEGKLLIKHYTALETEIKAIKT